MTRRRRERRLLAAAVLALLVPFAGTAAEATPARAATESHAVQHHAGAASPRQARGVVVVRSVIDYDRGISLGTGLVLRREGRGAIVVTNHHVVVGSTSTVVKDPTTGRRYRATVLGYDATRDVALLRLAHARHLHPVVTHRRVRLGEAIAAVGNAFGKGRITAATGRLLDRRVNIKVVDEEGVRRRVVDLIKISADVVVGDSGGALLDGHDRVIGMDVAASADPKRVIGYAIPIGRVRRIADLIARGHATTQITIGPRAALGVSLDAHQTRPYVVGVVRGGPAAAAGLAKGDVLTSIGSTPVSTRDQVANALDPMRPGQQVAVGWNDSAGAAHTATVTLWAGPVG